jgi:hypothetical protein
MNLQTEIRRAVKHFWKVRSEQTSRQGPNKDRGARSQVTGGKQLDGFVSLTKKIIVNAGIPNAAVFTSLNLELPGYFRPEKKWDLVVILDGDLLAAVEFESQVGPSFGNNYNNRSEEAIGNALDIWTAYREGAFNVSKRPWLGFLMLLEDTEKSKSPVKVREPNFEVFPEFKMASYANRYGILLSKLIRERLYDSTCLLLSPQKQGRTTSYSEPHDELASRNSLRGFNRIY